MWHSTESVRQIYGELRRIAAARMRAERSDHTLQPTALVHEVYLRLARHDGCWQSRAHFVAAAAEAMRRILIEHARRRATQMRGGDHRRLPHDVLSSIADLPPADFLELNDAIEVFWQSDPLKADLVKLRCFAGLNQGEAAELLGISRATADRYWAYAKLRLYRALYREK
jgi:RNA polymerase sigma factor (TIGR02999 family)